MLFMQKKNFFKYSSVKNYVENVTYQSPSPKYLTIPLALAHGTFGLRKPPFGKYCNKQYTSRADSSKNSVPLGKIHFLRF